MRNWKVWLAKDTGRDRCSVTLEDSFGIRRKAVAAVTRLRAKASKPGQRPSKLLVSRFGRDYIVLA